MLIKNLNIKLLSLIQLDLVKAIWIKIAKNLSNFYICTYVSFKFLVKHGWSLHWLLLLCCFAGISTNVPISHRISTKVLNEILRGFTTTLSYFTASFSKLLHAYSFHSLSRSSSWCCQRSYIMLLYNVMHVVKCYVGSEYKLL